MKQIKLGQLAKGDFTLECEQWVGRSLEDVFGFFSDPSNLEALTPHWLKFRMLEKSTPSIQVGTKLDYSLRVHGIPLRWRSLISCWNPPFGFVDEQLRGPYRSWVHRHQFEESDQGVLVKDSVRYSIPGGALINWLFVRRDLQRIFEHRRETLAALLPDRSPRTRSATTQV